MIKEHGIRFIDLESICEADCVILAGAHTQFKELTLETIDKMFKSNDNSNKVIIDVKGVLDSVEIKKGGYRYWRL